MIPIRVPIRILIVIPIGTAYRDPSQDPTKAGDSRRAGRPQIQTFQKKSEKKNSRFQKNDSFTADVVQKRPCKGRFCTTSAVKLPFL